MSYFEANQSCIAHDSADNYTADYYGPAIEYSDYMPETCGKCGEYVAADGTCENCNRGADTPAEATCENCAECIEIRRAKGEALCLLYSKVRLEEGACEDWTPDHNHPLY